MDDPSDRDKRILEIVNRMSWYIECDIEPFLNSLLHQVVLESDRRVMENRTRAGRKSLNHTLQTGKV